MTCPRCGFANAESPSCSRCGVIFAKIGQERPRPARPVPAPPPPRPSTPLVRDLAIAVAVVAAGLVWWRISPRPLPPPPPPPPPRQAPPAATRDVPALIVPKAAEEVRTPPPSNQLAAADYKTFEDLAAKIPARNVTTADIDESLRLQGRYPEEPALQRLVLELIKSAAFVHHDAGRFADAVALLRKAVALPWADIEVRHLLLDDLMSSADWPGTEAYARQLVAADSTDAEAWYALGYALFRLDRSAEAIPALRTCLSLKPDDQTQALLARIEKTRADERGMTEQKVARFHVRYDGDEHVEIGHEIVAALERHYATLENALDHRPSNAVPVILFSGEKYHEAAGVPFWAGGSFDNLDGRIRMPIGGLTRSLTPMIDSILMHELTHAFIADRSRGLAPRDVQEGMAQYMEGHRSSSSALTALAKEQGGNTVRGFYAGALAFVEYLVGQRGAGGMNDLIKAMGETGSVNEAFTRVYGQDHEAIRKAWVQRLRQQYGS